MRLKLRVTKKIINYLFKIMIKTIKNYMLVLTKQLIQKQQNVLTGYKPVIGFKVDRTGQGQINTL